MDGAVDKEYPTQNTIESLREQLLYVRYDVYTYCQRFPVCTERLTSDISDGLSSLLYSLSTEVKKLLTKQSKDIGTIVKTELEAIDACLRSRDNKRSWPDLLLNDFCS